MEMKIKSQVQFNDDLSQRSNIVSGDSLSNSFAKIHHDLNDYEIAANIAANDRPKNLLYIHDILSDSVSTATEEILGYSIEAGTYVYSAEIYTVQNPSVANVTKIEFLGADGNTVVGTCNITCDTKKEEHINVTLSDEAYYIKYYRDTYSSETVGYLKTSKQMICLPNVYAAFPEYTMYAPSLGETFLEVEDSVKTYDVQDTYDSSSYKAISGKGVAAAIGTLDVLSVGGSGKYISAIREEDGKIATTPTTFDTALSSSSTDNNAPTSKAVYDDQQRQEVEIGAVANRGAKNLLKFRDNVPSASAGNVYANINADGTLSVGLTSGTTATAQLVFTFGSITNYRDRKLILSGCPTGGNYQSGYALYVSNDGSTAQTDTGSGATIPIVTGITSSVVALMVRNGTTISSELTFRPMVRDASIVDSTFVPYAKTNRELTIAEGEDRAVLAEVIDGGAVGTKNHCTLASGSNTPPARWINIPVSDVGVGQWVMRFGTLTSTDTDNTLCQAICFNSSDQQVSNWVNFKREPNTNKTFIITDTVSYVRLYPANSYATSEGDTVTFTNAMLSPKVLYDADPSYVPYAPAFTNIILTPALIEQVDEGAKNIADASKSAFDTRTLDGVTVTRNNMEFTVTGTSGILTTSFFNIYIIGPSQFQSTGTIPAGDWVACIEGTGTGIDEIRLGYGHTNGVIYADYGEPLHFHVTATETLANLIRILIKNSTSYNCTFKLMICTKAAWDVSHAYEPYALPNPVLTPAAIKAVDEGAKNLLKITAASSVGNVNFTVNGDGTITVDGTAGTSDAIFLVANELTIPAGNYYISMFDNSAYYSDKMYIAAQFKNTPSGSSTWIGHEYYTDTQINPAGDIQAVAIVVKAGQTISQTVQPMICTAADWAVSQKFVPYCPTNRELYEMIKALQNNS